MRNEWHYRILGGFWALVGAGAIVHGVRIIAWLSDRVPTSVGPFSVLMTELPLGILTLFNTWSLFKRRGVARWTTSILSFVIIWLGIILLLSNFYVLFTPFVLPAPLMLFFGIYGIRVVFPSWKEFVIALLVVGAAVVYSILSMTGVL